MRYIYTTMPDQIVKALKYVSKLNEETMKYQLKHEKIYS